MLMFASCFSVVNAQLMVDENGRIGMNIDTTATLISNVGFNSLGESNTSVFIKQDAAVYTIGLGVRKKGAHSGTGNSLMSISGRGDVEKNNNINKIPQTVNIPKITNIIINPFLDFFFISTTSFCSFTLTTPLS